MENLAAFDAKEVKRAPAKERNDRTVSLQKGSGSQSKRQSRSNELSEKCKKKPVCLIGRAEKGGQLEALGGDHNSGSEVPRRCKRE